MSGAVSTPQIRPTPNFRHEYGLYSGTAAADLRELEAPVLDTIAAINKRMSRGTAVDANIFISHSWPQPEVEMWLAPFGCALRHPADPIDARLHERWGLAVGQPLRAISVTVSDRLDPTPGVVAYVWNDNAVVDPPDVTEHSSPAFNAFKELVGWLQATDADVAAMVGVGRTTPYSWKREGREPRRENVRRLFAAHTVVAALVRRLGEDDATQWLVYDDPSRRERILAGDLASIQAQARDLLFPRRRRRERAGAWRSDDDPEG